MPKWSRLAGGSYTWHTFGDYSVFAGASWSYIGARWNDFSPRCDGGHPQSAPRAGGYNTVNLRLGLENTRWTFLLWAKNIADSRGITNYGSTGTPNLGGSVIWQQPLSVGATVTARF